MRRLLKQLAERIDALSLRERGFVFVGLIAIAYLAWDIFLLQPISNEHARLGSEITLVQERVAASSRRIQEMMTQDAVDPNRRLQEEQAELQKALVILDERLAQRTANVVEPDEMAVLLEQVLERQRGLRLISMESLGALPVFADDVAGNRTDVAGGSGIFRHGLELQLEGSYLDLLDYLRALETLESNFFWEALEIETIDYPKNRIRLRVYTLSLSEDWIGV